MKLVFQIHAFVSPELLELLCNLIMAVLGYSAVKKLFKLTIHWKSVKGHSLFDAGVNMAIAFFKMRFSSS